MCGYFACMCTKCLVSSEARKGHQIRKGHETGVTSCNHHVGAWELNPVPLNLSVPNH